MGYHHVIALILLLAPIGLIYHDEGSYSITNLQVNGTPGKIVFISDPHLRDSNIENVKEIISEINALHPDAVLIGGDFTYLGDDAQLNSIWSRIDAPKYAILGNHDYMAGMGRASILKKMDLVKQTDLQPDTYNVSILQNEVLNTTLSEEIVQELENANVTVLRNEVATVDINGKKVVIVGLDDGWAGKAQPPVVPMGDFIIYMIHEPDCRADWPDANIILAGHTHGGQIVPDGLQVLNDLGIIELSGLKTRNGIQTYITRGIGTSNSDTQIRFNAPPEIVVIT